MRRRTTEAGVMAEFNTAKLCRFLARPSTRVRRGTLTLLATAGAVGTVAVPAAGAHRHHPAHRAHPEASCAGAHTRISAVPRSEIRAAVVCLINAERISRRLPGLHENDRLDRSAQGWTNIMVRVHDFTHGAHFASRISAVGFGWSTAGENIAAGFPTPAAVVRAWMASPGHCRNILSPAFLYVGTGVSWATVAGARGRGTWTQDFGLPLGAHSPSRNTGPANGCPY